MHRTVSAMDLPTIRHKLRNTYSMVERSIADIYDQGAYIFTNVRSAEVVYRGYRPAYCTVHESYIVW